MFKNILKILRCIFTTSPMKSSVIFAKTQKVHDYTEKRWGHNIATYEEDKGIMVGWGLGINPGDHILLQDGTKVQVEEIGYYANVRDMWKAKVAKYGE